MSNHDHEDEDDEVDEDEDDWDDGDKEVLFKRMMRIIRSMSTVIVMIHSGMKKRKRKDRRRR